MKTLLKNYLSWLMVMACFAACRKNGPIPPSPYYVQADQMGRPAINTVFISPVDKDKFN
jgi:hypothetical protein